LELPYGRGYEQGADAPLFDSLTVGVMSRELTLPVRLPDGRGYGQGADAPLFDSLTVGVMSRELTLRCSTP